jgi:dihydropteroate synthase
MKIFKGMYIDISGKLMDLARPRVMGIINITDNSFYSGSRYTEDDEILKIASGMLEEGADILDIGGCSTRPGSEEVPEAIERERVCRAVELILKRFPDAVISVDTYRASVAEAAVTGSGAAIINDISGGVLDPEMFPLVIRLKVPYILMHMQGPHDMQGTRVMTMLLRHPGMVSGGWLPEGGRVKDILSLIRASDLQNADHKFGCSQFPSSHCGCHFVQVCQKCR